MAELFLAKDSRREGYVVLKRILPYLAQEEDFVRMFLDEARIASQLHHPNIAELYELGQRDGTIFIAMEYIDGVDLRKLATKELKRHGAIPANVAAFLTAQLCAGLGYAHHRVGVDGNPLDVIHRDISPQNLMVSFKGAAKLVDFGIAKASAFVERSKPGILKGKFLYLSPEQVAQERIDHRSDLFALGTMLYEVTVGKNPFQKASTEAVIFAVKGEDPPPPHEVKAGYPAELSRIVMKCLKKDRRARYQEAEHIRTDLLAFLSKQGPTTPALVAAYVDTLFGGKEEQTVFQIEQKAVAAPAPRTLGIGLDGAVEATEKSLQSLGDGPDERTQMAPPLTLPNDPLTTPGRPQRRESRPIRSQSSEGRRPTKAETDAREAPVTAPAPASGVTRRPSSTDANTTDEGRRPFGLRRGAPSSTSLYVALGVAAGLVVILGFWLWPSAEPVPSPPEPLRKPPVQAAAAEKPTVPSAPREPLTVSGAVEEVLPPRTLRVSAPKGTLVRINESVVDVNTDLKYPRGASLTVQYRCPPKNRRDRPALINMTPFELEDVSTPRRLTLCGVK